MPRLARVAIIPLILLLPPLGACAHHFDARGVGSAEPLTAGTSEQDKQRNRRVAVRIEPVAERAQP